MEEKIVAIYMEEDEYGKRLKEYFYQQGNLPFTVISFSSWEAISQYEMKHNIGILLTDRDRKESFDEHIQTVILTNNIHLEQQQPLSYIFKYQSIEAIIGRLLESYKQQVVNIASISHPSSNFVSKKTTIIGVYSPIGRCLKTSFSLILAQILSKRESVLYLSLESMSGLCQLLHKEPSYYLSDIIFALRENNLEKRINGMIDMFDEVSYIPPVKCPEDLKNISAEEFVKALDIILKEYSYSTVVIDVGEGFLQPDVILSICNTIYMPIKEDVMSQCKIEAFEQMLYGTQNEYLFDNIQKIKLPYSHCFSGRQTYLEQLMGGELGDYTRSLIKG